MKDKDTKLLEEAYKIIESSFKPTDIRSYYVDGIMTYDNGMSQKITMTKNEYEAYQIKEKLLSLIPGDKKQIKNMLEDLEQLSYERGSEAGYESGYETATP